MASNIFEELQDKKQKLIALAKKAAEYGWIPQHKGSSDKNVISYDEILEKLKNDTLTIGVIGQMKCGKSTFLNSFVFENDILPAATTPMTAALSVITYGDKEKVVAEFYTQDEWAEQKMQASRSLDDVAGNSLEESKIKAAKELVAKSSKLGSSLESLLGKTKEDYLSNLIEYVGADGKYVSITKSVTIYYPKEYLQGVEIVDTPGFNDPIVSREERTKSFLKKADVVLMMLYAGRPFDATDRDIIFENVRHCGIGKVLVGINKYDIPYCNETNPEDEGQIKDYVKAEISKACRECNDSTLVEILSEVEPIPLSAEMALLSELPMSKITSIDAYNFAWKRHCDGFGISTQAEMRKWSHLDSLVFAVKEMVDKEKNKLLFAKPINAIVAAGDKINADNEKELRELTLLIEGLNKPDSELDEEEENLAKANRRLNKKISSLEEDIDYQIRNLIQKGSNELEDIVDSACNRLNVIVDNEWGRFKSFNSIQPKLDDVIQKLQTRDLKRACDSLAENGKREMKKLISEFFADADDILMRYIPDFDCRDFVKSTGNRIDMVVGDPDLFTYDASDDDDDSLLLAIFNGATFGLANLLGNALCHGEDKARVKQVINKIKAEFDPEPYLISAFSSKELVVKTIKEAFINDLIEPLQEQIKTIREKRADKEKTLRETQSKLAKLENVKKTISVQLSEINNMKNGL